MIYTVIVVYLLQLFIYYTLFTSNYNALYIITYTFLKEINYIDICLCRLSS